MPRIKFSATDLDRLRRQLNTWRQSQSGYRQLPEAVWSSAVTLAATHGVGCVARTLRVDYSKLKRQLAQASPSPAPVCPPTFVELPLNECWPRASSVCRVELSDGTAAKVRVELPYDPSAVVSLAQAFWRRG